MSTARDAPSEELEPINLADYETLARRRLDPMAYDYYASGAMDERTLGENATAFDRLRLRYRVLRDLTDRSVATTVLGVPLDMPILVAPTAFHRLADPEGEVATARAAKSRGTAMILSTLSTCAIEDVAAAAGPLFFQLYVYRDRGLTRALVDRAVAAGCRALVLTVDAQVWGRRERDVRNRFTLPPGLELCNLSGSGGDRLPQSASDSGLGTYVNTLFDPALTWRDLEWLVSLSDLPVVVKGVVHPDDARRAADFGARAVAVSNHGGRQLDSAPAAFDALPAIVDALAGRSDDEPVEVLLDGGVRRGTDVIKALACGARAVAVGRPVLWGLAARGEAGVSHVLDLLRDEVDLAMALCGCSRLDQLDRDLLFLPGSGFDWARDA